MNAPTAFSAGHPLHPMHARFVFQLSKNPVAFDMGHKFFDAAQFCSLVFNDVKGPALGFDIALIHTDEICGKQRCLIASGARANFQNGGSSISGIFWQQRQLQIMFRFWQRRTQNWQLFSRQLTHIRIIHHRLSI